MRSVPRSDFTEPKKSPPRGQGAVAPLLVEGLEELPAEERPLPAPVAGSGGDDGGQPVGALLRLLLVDGDVPRLHGGEGALALARIVDHVGDAATARPEVDAEAGPGAGHGPLLSPAAEAEGE